MADIIINTGNTTVNELNNGSEEKVDVHQHREC